MVASLAGTSHRDMCQSAHGPLRETTPNSVQFSTATGVASRLLLKRAMKTAVGKTVTIEANLAARRSARTIVDCRGADRPSLLAQIILLTVIVDAVLRLSTKPVTSPLRFG